jgi:hypothetical protein
LQRAVALRIGALERSDSALRLRLILIAILLLAGNLCERCPHAQQHKRGQDTLRF